VPKPQEPNLDPEDVARGPVAQEVRALIRAHESEGAPPAPFDRLTDQELRVATAYALGTTRADLARAMGLSVRTVDSHRGHAFAKLGVRTEAELARLAIRVGFVSCDRTELRTALRAFPDGDGPRQHGFDARFSDLWAAAWRTIGGHEVYVIPSRVNTADLTAVILAEDHTTPPWKHLEIPMEEP
jgi:DNA-binding CsgD family transcriptional regulator